jgi:hypothetical protein
MSIDSATLKQYEEKISAQLQQARAQLEVFEARAKEMKGQAEIEAVKALNATKRSIDEKHRQLQTAAGAKASQIKAEIDAAMPAFKTSLEQHARKFKGQATQETSRHTSK